MQVYLNGMWNSSSSYISRIQFKELTPLQKKVAYLALFVFTLAAGYFIYQCWRQRYGKTISSANLESKSPTDTSHLKTDQPISKLPEIDPSAPDKIVLDVDSLSNADKQNKPTEQHTTIDKATTKQDAADNVQNDNSAIYTIKLKQCVVQVPKSELYTYGDYFNALLISGMNENSNKTIALEDLEPEHFNLLRECAKGHMEKYDLNDPETWLSIKLLAERFGLQKTIKELPSYPTFPSIDDAIQFVVENQLTELNLSQFKKDMKDNELSNLPQHLTSLILEGCDHLTDDGLAHLAGMQLTHIDISSCPKLTDNALAHLKGMPLTSINLNYCKLTDNAFAHLKGMPLTKINICNCVNLTDNAFASLQGMPLTHLHLNNNKQLTDNALVHLKGMALTSIQMSCCDNLTDNALAHLKGMPLTSIHLDGLAQLTGLGLAHLAGMPLTNIRMSGCNHLTDDAFAHLKGMPLTYIDLDSSEQLTDNALLHLKGMPLTYINLRYCSEITDNGLAYLKGMPLTQVNFEHCSKITDKGLVYLKGMPLVNVNFSDCNLITDNALEHLKGMPLKCVVFSRCKLLTDNALLHLKGTLLKNV